MPEYSSLLKIQKPKLQLQPKDKGLLSVNNGSSVFVDDLVAQHPSVGIRAGPQGLSLPGHSGSAVKGVLVSWEREPQPSPDAEALPRDSVMSPDWRKCSVRAGKAGPGSLSAACTAAGWETKSLCSFSEA